MPPRSPLSWIRGLIGSSSAPAPATPPLADPVAERLKAALAENRLIETEYPYVPKARPFETSAGGRRISAMCEAASGRAREWLDEIERLTPHFQPIQETGSADGEEPFWDNGMLPVLDGMILYALIVKLKPKTYLEVGSGNSTKFVRRAIRDHGLATRIVSIDPHPRAVIDSLCDEVIREPFEEVPVERYVGMLQPNDVVFVDNSHRSFQNSDVTVFFTEVLPALRSGVVYGLHDIFLPADYPADWLDRFYNEQFLLAAYLLGGADGDRIEFPTWHVAYAPQFAEQRARTNEMDRFLGIPRHGAGFWMRRR